MWLYIAGTRAPQTWPELRNLVAQLVIKSSQIHLWFGKTPEILLISAMGLIGG